MNRTNAPVVDGLQINNWSRGILEEVVRAGISGVNATCAVWEDPAETLRNIGDWYEFAEVNKDLMVLATDMTDVETAKETGRVAVLLGFQNASPFADDYKLVEVFHRLGVRVAQLTYNIQNLVGSACYEAEDSGLSRFGRRIVSEMNRVGMVIDLSHVGNRTSMDAIEASEQPVAITHANPAWFVDSPRNKPQYVIDALVERGGVIGCCLYPNIIGGAGTTREEFSSMVVQLVDTIGPEHVAIGSDSTRGWDDRYVQWLRSGRWQPLAESATWPQWPTWFSGPEDFPRLAEGLLDAGMSEEDLSLVLGGNWMRLFEQIFSGGQGS